MEICEKVDKFSARSDEMRIWTFLRGVQFELNYAEKGVLLAPKAGLPPLIIGSLFVDFLYELLKRGLFWTNSQQDGSTLSLEIRGMCKYSYLRCARTVL
jgi:hypothetical protein